MAKTKPKSTPHIQYHKDGTLTRYWEWFRTDGTKLRSGYFENGEQSGDWTTYDHAGKV